MSKAVIPIRSVLLEDPVTRLSHPTAWGIPGGGIVYTYQPNKATSTNGAGSGNITWVCPPPSPEIIVDRRVWMQVQFYLTFQCTAAMGVPVLQLGLHDGPRAFPLMQAINTVSATINNNTITALMDPIIALMRYNLPFNLQNQDYSGTPCMMDQFQEYDFWQGLPLVDQTNAAVGPPQGVATTVALPSTNTVPGLPMNQDGGAIRNPLAPYGGNMTVPSRGGFLMQVVQNPVGDGVTPLTAAVILTVTEPIFMTPFAQWGEEPGFYGIQTMNISLTLNANWWLRTWSSNPGKPQGVLSQFNPYNTNNPVVGTVNSLFSTAGITGAIPNQPLLLFRYITPSPIKTLPPLMEYPYTSIQVFTTTVGAVNSIYAQGGGQAGKALFTSNAVQFNTIPDMIYIYVMQQQQDRNHMTSDTFAPITNISVNFMNQTGLLSSCSQWDLYNICKRNGYVGSFDQWALHTGSVLCLKPGLDLGLEPSLAPGMNGLYNFQVQVSFFNAKARAVNYTLYVVPVTEGLVTIKDNGTVTQTGILTRSDVLGAQQAPSMGYQQAVQMVGGNFFGNLKNILARGAEGVGSVITGAAPAIGNYLGNAALGAVRSRLGFGRFGAGLNPDEGADAAGIAPPLSADLPLDYGAERSVGAYGYGESDPSAGGLGLESGSSGRVHDAFDLAREQANREQYRKRRMAEADIDAGPPQVVSRRQLPVRAPVDPRERMSAPPSFR